MTNKTKEQEFKQIENIIREYFFINLGLCPDELIDKIKVITMEKDK